MLIKEISQQKKNDMEKTKLKQLKFIRKANKRKKFCLKLTHRTIDFLVAREKLYFFTSLEHHLTWTVLFKGSKIR